MSEMMTNGASDDTLIRDSQLSGFASFKERIGSCCCRVFKKSSNYNLSSVSKNVEEQDDKPSYINQAFQKEKQERKEKLDQIAKSIPSPRQNGKQGTPFSQIQSSTRTITTKTQETPRSGITRAQTRPPTASTPIAKSGTSTINKSSPLPPNVKTNKKDSDETSTDDSSEEEEESSSEEDHSSDSDSAPAKPTPGKSPNKR